jgi:AraC-like DNA-binding protein
MDAAELSGLLAIALGARLKQPMAALTDISRVTHVDPTAFALLRRFALKHRAEFGHALAAQAIVYSRSQQALVEASAGGFYPPGQRSFPVRRFTDTVAALQWLGRKNAASEARALDALLAIEVAASEPIQRVREHLDAHRRRPRLAVAAEAIGLTPRTLQNLLRRANTSFRQEIAAARLRAAHALLANERNKLETVALEAGYSSRQRLSAAIRRFTGLTPRQLRSRSR